MSRDLPSDSGGFGQGQGCLPGRGAKVGRENGTQNRMALLRVGEAGLWDTGPAVHHRGGANGTRARELQENRRWTMAVPGVPGEACTVSPVQTGTRPEGACPAGLRLWRVAAF